MYAYDIPKRTQQDLLDEKEYEDYKKNVELNPRGIPGHLLCGHGPELTDFEKRDIATTKNLAYEEKQNAGQITHSMTYHQTNTKVDKMMVNTKPEDVPQLFGGLVTSNERKPKGYGDYTKRCDKNYHKLGLRN